MSCGFKVGDLVKFRYYYPEDDKLYLILNIAKDFEVFELLDLEVGEANTYVGSWVAKHLRLVKKGE